MTCVVDDPFLFTRAHIWRRSKKDIEFSFKKMTLSNEFFLQFFSLSLRIRQELIW